MYDESGSYGKWNSYMTVKFVEEYKSHECLWDFKSPLYKQNRAREAAYRSIVDVMNLPDFDVADVKIKIKNLRSTYSQEKKKVAQSLNSNSGYVYESKLSWFKLFDSMQNGRRGKWQGNAKKSAGDKDPLKSISTAAKVPPSKPNASELNASASASNARNSRNIIFIKTQPNNQTAAHPPMENYETRSDNAIADKVSKRKDDTKDTFSDHCSKVQRISTAGQKDETSLYIDLLEKKLRAFNESSREIIMHEIDNIIFKFRTEERNQMYRQRYEASVPVITSLRENPHIVPPHYSPNPSQIEHPSNYHSVDHLSHQVNDDNHIEKEDSEDDDDEVESKLTILTTEYDIDET